MKCPRTRAPSACRRSSAGFRTVCNPFGSHVSVRFQSLLPAHPTIGDICWRMAICGIGFGLFQAPNNRMMITSTPRARSGAASGMLGTARLLGQSLGAAFVAFLLAQWGVEGSPYILFIASGFALFASVISFSRLGAHRLGA